MPRKIKRVQKIQKISGGRARRTVTEKENNPPEGEELLATFDDCAVCRLLGSREGTAKRRKFLREFDKQGGNIRGCARIMQAISSAWWSHEMKRLIAEPKFERRGPKEISGFKIPEWWECQWRRVPCRSADCTFCARIEALDRFMTDEPEEEKEESAARTEGEAAGAGENVAEKNFENLMKVVRHQAKDLGVPEEWLLGGAEIVEDDFDEDGNFINEAEELPENMPPEPEKFILYRRVTRWSRPVLHYMGKASDADFPWAKSEAAEDLLWYAAMLPAKVYRQLSTRFEKRNTLEKGSSEDNEPELFSVELGYTGYVLREITAIIERSLAILAESSGKKSDFETALKSFRRLKSSVLEITQ